MGSLIRASNVSTISVKKKKIICQLRLIEMLVIVEACLLFLKVDDNVKENPVTSVSVEVDYTHCYLLYLLTRHASMS